MVGARIRNEEAPAAAEVLEKLRALSRNRGLSSAEAYRVAEWQAIRLLELGEIIGPPVPQELITELAGVPIMRRSLPFSGISTLTKRGWIIAVCAGEPAVRQRFTAAHELKHVIDDNAIGWLYPKDANAATKAFAEEIADYFAACLLMPRRFVKHDYCDGIQNIMTLARRYEVSTLAMNYRLQQLGLIDPAPRCASSRNQLNLRQYFRPKVEADA